MRKVREDPRYSVSNLGRVRGVGGQLTKGNQMKTGYVDIKVAGTKRVYVHRLVAVAFLGEPPPGQPDVHHIDGDGRNNRATNLMWVSHRQNLAFARRAGTLNNAGENNVHAKLTWAQVREIRQRYRRGRARAWLAKRFGVSKQTVDRVVTHQTWKEVA